MSVLEGGYGEYDPSRKVGGGMQRFQPMVTRHSRHSSDQTNNNNNSTSTSAATITSTTTIDMKDNSSLLKRDILVAGAVAHLERLIDPYGP